MFEVVGAIVESIVLIFTSEISEGRSRELYGTKEYLKRQEWYKEYLSDDSYKYLLEGNKKVNKAILNLNTNKFSDEYYVERWKQKFIDVLEREKRKASG